MAKLTSEDPKVKRALETWDTADIDQAHKALDAIKEQIDGHGPKDQFLDTLEAVLALAYAGLSVGGDSA